MYLKGEYFIHDEKWLESFYSHWYWLFPLLKFLQNLSASTLDKNSIIFSFGLNSSTLKTIAPLDLAQWNLFCLEKEILDWYLNLAFSKL